MRFKGATRDPREVGRELDVHVVVEGSVRRGKGSFRVNTRLVSVVDGLQLWARRFDVPEAELLAHNDIIAQAVAEALGVAVAAPERSPADSKAVELYLRARDAYHRVFSGDVNAVLKCFDDALAHSPNDPRLLAGRAMTGAMRWVWDPKSRAENESFADRVLKLAPSLAEAHAARGTFLFYDGQRTASVVPLRRALMLSPNNFDAHVCLGRLMHEADHPAGRRHLETAAALDPSSELPRVNWAADLALHGQWDAAYEASSLLRGNRKVPMLLVQSRLVIWEGDVERARRLLPLIDPNDPRESVVVGWLRVVLDKVAPPPMQLPPRPVLAPTMRDFFDEVVCEIACSLGDVPTALAALARLDEADAQPRAWLERAPPLALIRDMPEVQPIRERIAARAARTVTEYEREL